MLPKFFPIDDLQPTDTSTKTNSWSAGPNVSATAGFPGEEYGPQLFAPYALHSRPDPSDDYAHTLNALSIFARPTQFYFSSGDRNLAGWTRYIDKLITEGRQIGYDLNFEQYFTMFPQQQVNTLFSQAAQYGLNRLVLPDRASFGYSALNFQRAIPGPW